MGSRRVPRARTLKDALLDLWVWETGLLIANVRLKAELRRRSEGVPAEEHKMTTTRKIEMRRVMTSRCYCFTTDTHALKREHAH